MGDRGNIVVRDNEGKDVVFYAHWSGGDIAAVVRRALAKEWRWDDETYLARIIFCEMVKGNEGEGTGFGIGRLDAGDREHPIVLVDVKGQAVYFTNEYEPDKSFPTNSDFSWSFEAYIKMTDEDVTASLSMLARSVCRE